MGCFSGRLMSAASDQKLFCHLLLDHIWFTLIHERNISGSYAILFFTAWDFTFTTRHIHNWASFLLWSSHFFLSGTVSSCPPLFPSLACWMPSDLGDSSCSVIIFLPFLTVYGVLQTRMLKLVAISSSSGPFLSALFSRTHLSWVTLYTMADGFTELWKSVHHYKAVIHTSTKQFWLL